MKHRTLLLLPVVALALSGLSAQQPLDVDASRATRAALSEPGLFRTPIHDEAGIDGRPGGIWATGPNYKVSFQGGMRFFPLLGPSAPRNLPFAWRTTDVTVGGVEIVDLSARAHSVSEDWRMEYRWRAFTEAYDVRADGVEQTFVLTERPSLAGEFVVCGRVTSDLVAPVSAPAHAPLVFHDAIGNAVVEYGSAVAFDAAGRRIAITTEFDGSHVRLTVPGVWLEAATYPVTIDPLVSSVALDASNPNTIAAAAVVHEPSANEIIVVLTRVFSGSDHDIFGINYLPNWTAPLTVFASSLEFSTERNPEIAYIAQSDRWMTVFERQSFGSNPEHRIGYHTHPAFGWTLDTSIFDLSQAAGTSRRNPDIGGTRPGSTGRRAAIVCEEEANLAGTDTSATQVRMMLFDLATNSVVYSDALGTAFSDVEHPSINQQSAGGGAAPWVFAFQTYVNLTNGDDWDVQVGRLFPAGSWVTSGVQFGVASNGLHSLAPQIAGSGDRYMVTYLARTNLGFPTSQISGHELRATQFRWPLAASDPTIRHDFRLRQTGFAMLNSDLAYDTTTEGHWAALSHPEPTSNRFMTVQRVAEDVVVERIDVGVGSGITTPHAACYDATGERFPIFFSDQSGAETWGTSLEHPTTPVPAAFGTQCGAATIDSYGDPLSGSQNFGLSLDPPGTTAGSPAALLISNGAAILPLDVAGFTGCFANIDLGVGYIGSIPVTATSSGASIDVPLPGDFSGSAYFQWAYSAVGLNPGGFGFTRGLHVVVVE